MRLLLIVDSTSSAWTLKRRLEQEGFTVDTATGENADGQARTDSYDVVVLDLPLAHQDGRDLVQRWRKSGLKTAVVALAPVGALAERIAMLDMGADDILTKPFQVEELLARLRALLRRDPSAQKLVQRVFDLEIDPDRRTVKRGGQEIRLTPREFALLQLLASHRGKVVSRSLICQHLYDEHEDQNKNTSNVVDVFIRYLRTKIDKGFEQRLILTRWGEGYLLRGESA